MEEVEPTWSIAVVVCANQRGAESQRHSCGMDAGRALRHWLRDRARAEGVRARLVVHAGGCMNVCGRGTTVALHRGDGVRLFVVGPDDREALWAEVRASIDGGSEPG